MKNLTKVLMALSGLVTIALQNPDFLRFVAGLVQSHPHVLTALGGAGAIAALAHNPKAN